MKTERNLKILVIAAITIAIGGLSIGFAAFSRTLTITGAEATVNSSSWDVHFENLVPSTTGTATTTGGSITPTNSTSITGIDMTLTSPGDSVTYTFDVVNGGDFDAIATTLNIDTPTCVGSGVNATVDATNVCNNLEYTLTYADGSDILTTPSLTTAEGTKSMKLTLTYSNAITADQLPASAVTVSDLNASILYSQN